MIEQPTPPAGLAVVRDVGTVVLGRYQLDAPLGSGGMGAVWKAHDRSLGRDVAIKIVQLVDPLTRARFVREGRLAARLDHRGLARIYDVGEEEGAGFLVMELLSGRTLTATGALPLGRVLAIVADAARAMTAAHAAGMVHRDLKPDNLFLDDREQPARVVVIDFGLSFAIGAGPALGRVTGGDIAGGTPGYMAPEQARADAMTAATDVYALGCVLFELCAGRLPFEGPPAAVMTKHVYAAAPALAELVPGLPRALDGLVARMLRKPPEERPTMAEVAAACDGIATEGPAASWPPLGFGRGKLSEDRAHRMLTRAESPAASPAGAPLGVAALIGPIDDDVLVAVAALGLAAQRIVDGADVVLADCTEARLAELVAGGRPVIAVAPAGDLQAAAALVRLGAADVVTRPVQADAAARKLERALRRRARTPR